MTWRFPTVFRSIARWTWRLRSRRVGRYRNLLGQPCNALHVMYFVSSLAEAVKRDGGVYLAPWVAFGLCKLQHWAWLINGF